MKLVLFDMDGTLVDSQHHIHAAMLAGLAAAGLPPLPRETVLAHVGLSLPEVVAALLPDEPHEVRALVTDGYRCAFLATRQAEEQPLYPGARDCLDRLASREDLLLGVATGKARRGLNALLESHGLADRFVSLQTADDHPSKPHPSMVLAALDETGIAPGDAVMVGDTSFDMAMARSAAVAGIGVGWGFHPPAALIGAGAALVAEDFPALARAIEAWAA